jgi:hypothetical protein
MLWNVKDHLFVTFSSIINTLWCSLHFHIFSISYFKHLLQISIFCWTIFLSTHSLYIYQPTICVIFLSKVIVIVLWDLWFIFQINITVVQVFLNVSYLLQVVEIICMIYLYYKRLMFLVSFDYFNLWIFAIYIYMED